MGGIMWLVLLKENFDIFADANYDECHGGQSLILQISKGYLYSFCFEKNCILLTWKMRFQKGNFVGLALQFLQISFLKRKVVENELLLFFN